MKSEQMRALLVGILLGLTIAFGVSSSPIDAAASRVGKYQVSTCPEGTPYPDIYVTVIDTETGQIVRQELHKSKRYEKIKEQKREKN